MKKITPLIIAALLVTSLYGYIDRERGKKLYLGFGLGIPFGNIGTMIELNPVNHLGLSLGWGTAIEGMGYSFGIRLYPRGAWSRWPFFFSGYYGVVGYIKDVKTFTGGAFGIGLRQPVYRWLSVSAEVLILSFDKEPGYSYGSNVKLAVGLQWPL